MKKIALGLMALSLISPLEAAQPNRADAYSLTHPIDKVIDSMEGAIDDQPATLLQTKTPELLWVTAGRVSIMDAETSTALPDDMLCHSHLMFPFAGFNASAHNELFKNLTHLDLKFFTFVQGHTEIRLPPNFGIPVWSNEKLHFSSMIINPHQPEKTLHANAKGTFEFYRDKDLRKPLKALFWRGIVVMVPIKDASSHEGCGLESQEVTSVVPTPSLPLVHKHVSGKFKESYHWMVPPGLHEYRYTLEYGGIMTPFDTTLHYINLHMHTYAVSLELRDITTGQSIFKGISTNTPDNSGVAHLTSFSSEEGIPVYKDHQYELVAVYNNTTNHPIDAMANMFIYLWDKTFDRERLTPPASAVSQPTAGKTAT